MSLATSGDYGLTWRELGQIITGPDAPAVGKNTGEGDCDGEGRMEMLLGYDLVS